MSAIERTPIFAECVASLCADVEKVYGRIAARADEYFVEGGCINGHDIDDWVRAEQELLVRPAARLRRDDSDFVIEVDLADTNPTNLQIRVTSRQMLLISLPFERRQIFRIVPFPEPIDPAGVQAGSSGGKLQIIAPIVAEPRRQES
jgi:HSP20 family molecular chaperone IbpA